MGAEVSSEAGYTAKQAADFERKYREMYGEDLSREDLIERYRMEKLKADQKRREQEVRQGREQQRRRSEEGYHNRRDRRSGSRDRDGRHSSRRRQQDNFDIIKSTYERSRRGDPRDREKSRHHRSRRHGDGRHDGERRSRKRYSRDRSRRSSSDSSTKENRRERDRDRSKKMDSSTGRRRSSSSEREKKSSRRSASSPGQRHKSSRGNRRKEENYTDSTKHRSSRKKRDDSQSSDEKSKDQLKKDSKTKRKDRTSEKENSAAKIRQKKKKNAKAKHYQSAPDLTETDRQYGKGPWQRTHMYFDEYSHRPQSWMEELAQGQSAAMPTPVMERQIIYSVPGDSSQMVDGLGYPLRERSPGFQPVPYETYLMPRSSRPLSLDMSYHQSEGFSSMQSHNTSVKLPVGSVPAIGPQSPGATSSPRTAGTIIPERGYEVQAHVPTKGTSSLPAHYRNGPSSLPPTYKTPPQYASSTLPRNHAPTPKPRTKSPTKELKSFPEESIKAPTSSTKQGKEHKSMITAVSAREDFESLLASDYDMSKMKMPSGDFSEEFPPNFLGNYRPNQEIFVDDVIFRKHPDVKEDSGSMTDSDVVTDEEHVLTLGEELSPNSVGYSSGYDLEIPEGFCFDSEVEKSSVKGKQHNKDAMKKKRGSGKVQQEPTIISRRTALPLNAEKSQQKLKGSTLTRSRPLVLGAVEPVSRQKAQTKSHKDDKSPTRKTFGEKGHQQRERRSRKQSSSPERQETIHQTKATVQKTVAPIGSKKTKNRKIQHPSNDGHHERVITISRKKAMKKETHSIDVGVKEMRQKKSAGSQTAKSEEQPEQPIYLKPISSQEVFIEGSQATRSETDFSQTRGSSTASSASSHARSAPSLSNSSSVTSGPERSEPSEMESSVHNFQRNSKLYASSRNSEPPVPSSVSSYDSEKPASVRPTSMVLGVSESIQASSYTGKGGKVFCLTRSRHESPTTLSKTYTDDHEGYDGHRKQHIYDNGRLDSEYNEFDAHEVGKWVLDCYAHDQKLTTAKSTSQYSVQTPREDPNDSGVMVRDSHGILTKQQAVEFEGSFQIESGGSDVSKQSATPNVVPLTQEALSKHEAYPGFHRSESREVESGTELSVDLNSDLDAFRKELIKARKRIRQAPEEAKEPEWKLDEYKAKLKQWNNSPSSNVVLAEVCSVNDEDFDPPSSNAGKKIHPQGHQPPQVSPPPEPAGSTDDTASQSTLSSETDDDTPRESVIQPIQSQSDPIVPPNNRTRPQLKQTVSLQKSGTQHGGLDKKDFDWDRNVRPSGGIKIAAQPNPGGDWRIVTAPKQQPPKIPQAKDMNDNLQQDPFVPRAEILRKSVNSALEMKPSNPPFVKPDVAELPPPKERTLSMNSNSTTSSSQIANPFNKMDEDEIESLVERIPGRKTLGRTGSEEEDILEKLKKSRINAKRESLEERTARILGIHRKTSDDDDEDDSDDTSGGRQKKVPSPIPPPLPALITSSNDRKIDVNTYMNNLLTGVADVSPASRKKFFLGDMLKNQHTTSPLATTSTSSKSSIESEKRNDCMRRTQENETSESSSSDGESSDAATITETFSVNVSDSVMEANIDCKVKSENKDLGRPNPPKEYEIPDDMGPKPREPMSPKGGMMLSYGRNIYAETPGFHKQQRSYDSTESDELELDSSNKANQKTNIPQRAQDSPVPISATSPPLTEKEIDIVRELVQTHSRTASHDSIGDSFQAPVNGTMKPPGALHVDRNRLSPTSAGSTRPRSWSPSREVARNKIAKSIGFTLPTENSTGSTDTTYEQPTSFSPDEYDIKILSADRKRATPDHQATQKDNPPLDGDNDSLENVMESIGLDPNEAWLLSV